VSLSKVQFDEKKNISVFTARFFTSLNRKTEMDNFMTQLKSDADFIKLHEITVQRAQMAN